MTPRLRTTIKDVAEAAGVSPATVSRCLNRPQSVREVLRTRVLDAVDVLDYVPNGAAQALATRRSRVIGAVVPSLDTGLFGRAVEALDRRLGEAGYTLFIASSSYDENREADHIRNLVSKGVDALVLIGVERDEAVYRILRAKQVPYVILWVSEPDGEHPCVGFDNRMAAGDAASYLLDLGHRRIAVITGRVARNDRVRARLEGVANALGARGLPLPAEYVIERPFGVDGGREAMRELMLRHPRPTGVVCGSELFACGAVFESAELGVRVPEEVSVTGFDDLWLAPHLVPPLTSVRTPQTQMGRHAADYLVSVLAGETPPTLHPLRSELVVRKSTAPPPAE